MSEHQLSDLGPSARNCGQKSVGSREQSFLACHRLCTSGSTSDITKLEILVKKNTLPLHPVPQRVKEMPPNFNIEDMSNPSLPSKILLPESTTWGKWTTEWAKPAHSLNQKEAAAVSMVSEKDTNFSVALEGAHIPWQQSLPLSSAVIKNHLSLSPYQALIKGSDDPQAEKCN